MLFNSIEFLIFFPIVAAVYYIFPKRARYMWLLLASWYFYMNWNPAYILLLLSCTTVTWAAGLILEKQKNSGGGTGKRKLCLIVTLLINLGILGFFKYFDFFLINLNRTLSLLHLGSVDFVYSVALPVGISFYTLQALGYLIDVYRGDIYAERNFFRYALFISFFPQLVAGPIERSKNLLVQLYKPQTLKWENVKKGILLMLWGLFLKLVIADRAAIIVDTVYGNSEAYQGFYIVAATLFFSMQIYCDFYGYSIIAKGAALVLGIHLTDNFNAPYFSRSVKEFWRRWHISLSGWFRDYLYIPLGGSRKGRIRKQANLLAVFAVSGLWHGASVAFIAWGMLNGVYQVLGNLWGAVKKRLEWLCGNATAVFSKRLLQRVFTFVLISFAWLFFRAGDMSDALDILRDMCHFNWYVLFDGSMYSLGVAKEYFHILLAAIALLLYVDYKKYRDCDVAESVMGQGLWFQALTYAALAVVILVFGCYGVDYDTSQFIYFQF